MIDKIVIYTAISGSGRDVLKDPPMPINGIDFVCFTDQPFKSSIWEVRPFERVFDTPVLTAKYPKIFPHLYFGDYDASIWIDGNIVPNKSIKTKCKDFLLSSNFALHSHPRRKCCYDEMDHLLERHSINGIADQIERYKRDGMPEGFGLWECGVLFRRHNEKNVIDLMMEWWNDIVLNQHSRDQMSFAYTLWKAGFDISTIHGNLRKKDYLKYSPHRNESRKSKPKTSRIEYINKVNKSRARLRRAYA